MPGLLRSHRKDGNTVLIGLAPTGRMAVSRALDNFSYLGPWSLRSQKQTVWGRLTSSLCAFLPVPLANPQPPFRPSPGVSSSTGLFHQPSLMPIPL